MKRSVAHYVVRRLCLSLESHRLGDRCHPSALHSFALKQALAQTSLPHHGPPGSQSAGEVEQACMYVQAMEQTP